MVKKISGIVFIIIALILGLAVLVGLPETIRFFITLFTDSSGYAFGYFFGNIFITVLFTWLAIYLFRKGIKCLKKKPKEIDTINEIGKN